MSTRSVLSLSVFSLLLLAADVAAQNIETGLWTTSTATRRTYEAASRTGWTTTEPIEAPVMIPSPSAGATVSLRELEHKVPPKAARELHKADQARQKQRNDEAIQHFRRAIEIDPELVPARNNIAALYLMRGEPGPAVDQLNEAIKMDPHNPMPFSNLAVAYLMLQRFPDAERAARETIELDRTGLRPHMILGITLVMQQKLTPEALRSLELAEGEYPQAHLMAARVLAAQGEVTKAASELRTYLASNEQSGRELANQWLQRLREVAQNNSATAALR